jgi:hypothetical protein
MEITHYFVVRVTQSADGEIVASECEEKLSAMAALTSARAYANEGRGAIAFSQRGDLPFGGPEPRRVIAGFGILPTNSEQFLRDLDISRR